MSTIGVDKSLSNIDLYEHQCLVNIKKLYKSDGKCDYEQQYKYILESTVVITSE